jgi:hypothetical protein
MENEFNRDRRGYGIYSILHGEHHVIQSIWNQLKKGNEIKVTMVKR